jgi:hypothetical protein
MLSEPFAGFISREWMTYIMPTLAIGIVFLTVQEQAAGGRSNT